MLLHFAQRAYVRESIGMNITDEARRNRNSSSVRAIKGFLLRATFEPERVPL